jgi:hypothetical protein
VLVSAEDISGPGREPPITSPACDGFPTSPLCGERFEFARNHLPTGCDVYLAGGLLSETALTPDVLSRLRPTVTTELSSYENSHRSCLHQCLPPSVQRVSYSGRSSTRRLATTLAVGQRCYSGHLRITSRERANLRSLASTAAHPGEPPARDDQQDRLSLLERDERATRSQQHNYTHRARQQQDVIWGRDCQYQSRRWSLRMRAATVRHSDTARQRMHSHRADGAWRQRPRSRGLCASGCVSTDKRRLLHEAFEGGSPALAISGHTHTQDSSGPAASQSGHTSPARHTSGTRLQARAFDTGYGSTSMPVPLTTHTTPRAPATSLV